MDKQLVNGSYAASDGEAGPALSWRVIVLVAVHVAVLGSGIGWAAYRVKQQEALKLLPVPHNEPLAVRPMYDEPEIVSDTQLTSVLTKLQPRFRGSNPKMNNI